MPPPTPPAQPAVLPIQFSPLTEADLKSPANLNVLFSQIINSLNQGSGVGGPTPLPAGADVRGSTISNLGEPQSPFDAVSKSHAERNYSAAALAPKLEQGGSTGLKSYRALNSRSQQELNSTFLNTLANTTPTTNTTVVTATPPSGGNVTITLPAGYHLFMDGSEDTFATQSVTVALPSTQNITSISRTSGIVTAIGSFSGLVGGESVYVNGFADNSFDGNFELATAGPTSLTWAQPNFANGSSTTGTVSTGGAYYFYMTHPSDLIEVAGPFPQDSQLYRLQSNLDNSTLIAVAIVNSSGLVTAQSAGGATVPIATNNGNHILSRL